jgi:cell wall-associated NlpC family hydrolase
MSLKKMTKVSIIAFMLFSASFSYSADETIEQQNNVTVSEVAATQAANQGFFSTTLDKVSATAKELLGTKYRFGGTDPQSGFDCSGFVRYVFKSANIDLPRSSYDMKKLGQPVDVKSLKVGDLLFFRINTSHVGIYIGNGKFIHSPTTGRSVTIESLADALYGKQLLSARRILTAE